MKELLLVAERGSAQKELSALLPSDRFKRWKTEATDPNELKDRESLPDLTIVDVPSSLSTSGLRKLADTLAEKQENSKKGYFLFLSFRWPEDPEKETLKKFLRHFRSPDRIQFYFRLRRDILKAAVGAIEPTIDVLRAKADKEAKDSNPPHPSMLDKMQKVLSATKDLREQRGRLSAKLIADLYGINQAELARWLGKQKQAVFKTPDADSLQNSLEYFERIARLRTELSDDDFRKWLRIPNELLDDKAPIELIAQGKWQLVADFVADMITGSPT